MNPSTTTTDAFIVWAERGLNSAENPDHIGFKPWLDLEKQKFTPETFESLGLRLARYIVTKRIKNITLTQS